jgi:ATP-dependent DNA ligase
LQRNATIEWDFKARNWELAGKPVARRRVLPRKLLSSLPAGKARFIDPMLCKGTKEIPNGEDWLYELKLEGYRAIAIKDGERVSLVSRNNKDLPYPEIVERIRELPFVHRAGR